MAVVTALAVGSTVVYFAMNGKHFDGAQLALLILTTVIGFGAAKLYYDLYKINHEVYEEYKRVKTIIRNHDKSL